MKKLLRYGAILAMSIFGLIAPEPHSSASTALPQSGQRSRALTFADRVAYQYSIEEVYWRHRIWPKENPGPKPSLDELIPAAAIEKKVEDYLRTSQLLADYWQRPITSDQLQAEIDRVAHHTKQPEVLRELFAALDDDPIIISECLARPILADRFICDRTAHNEKWRQALESVNPSTGTVASMRLNIDDARYELPDMSVPLQCTDDTWIATTTTNAPAGRAEHTAVWTGSEMIIWGGFNGSSYLSSGRRYNPSTDSWAAIPNAPTARVDHTAVWTGIEMIIWGGFDGTNFFNTGSKYDPTNNFWSNIPTGPVTARSNHAAVWTGSEMIIWGGSDGTGGRFNPRTNSWTATNTINAPIDRLDPTAVWTGSEMVVWGGVNGSYFNTGGKYNPRTDSWTATSITGAPSARTSHTAVWTGSEMIVWGGIFHDGTSHYLNTGGRYNSSTDSWTATNITNAPTARGFHTAVWTGSEMIVWGGSVGYLNTGGRYNPSTDDWTATALSDVPAGRTSHTAVWTGSAMTVWGGYAPGGSSLNTGGRYCAQPITPIVQSAVSRKSHGSAGSVDVDLPLSGTPGIECRSSGGTNDYTMVVTFLANVSIDGTPRAQVTSGIGTIGSGGVSNGGGVTISSNVVTIPLTNVVNVQTINVTLNGVNGSTNVIIPMRVLIGDVNGNGAVNASDVTLTKSRIGQPVNQTNFRSDANASGSINATDVSIVKSAAGTGLP